MKKLILLLAFILAFCSFTSAQTPRAVINKVRKIKILESTRDDVKRILAGFKLDKSDNKNHYQEFSNKKVGLEISYAGGKCGVDKDEDEDSKIWNVSEWKVVKIVFYFKNATRVRNIGYDLSRFKKEQQYANVKDSFIYHDKNSGIAFEAEKGEIKQIFLYPPQRYFSMLCDTSEWAKKAFTSESWFGNSKLEDRANYKSEYRDITGNYPTHVEKLILSETEITADCSYIEQNKNCSGKVKEISVRTIAVDTGNGSLTYKYVVSGGKIVGQGANVVWDLSGVKPGTYTITSGIDSGRGIPGVYGQTKTETVVVKECADCSVK